MIDERQNKIIEGAYNIFIKHGIRNVSMDDISRMMGISKKTLYQVVSNKADLLEQIGAHIQQTILLKVDEVLDKNLNELCS